jgi:hypothetical protein
MNSIRNSLGMPETEIAREPNLLRNPHFYAISPKFITRSRANFGELRNSEVRHRLGPHGPAPLAQVREKPDRSLGRGSLRGGPA